MSRLIQWYERPNAGPSGGCRIAALGDLAAIKRFDTALCSKPLEQVVDTAILEALRGADLTIANVEAPLTDSRDSPWPTGGLVGSPALAPVFREMGIDLAGLANNHIRDRKSRGVLDTIAHLQGAGIQTVGAGPDLEAAQKPWIGQVGDLRVGVYAVAQREFNVATAHRAGSSLYQPETLAEEVSALRPRCDFLIVYVHLGMEFYLTPSPINVEACRAAADAGADAVIGHHPHVPQSIEVRRGTPIFYSLGNFMFDSDYVSAYPHWDESFVVLMDVDGAGVRRVDLLPVRIAQGERVAAMSPSESETFEALLRDISRVLESPQRIREAWVRDIRKVFDERIRPRLFDQLGERLSGQDRTMFARFWFNMLQCPAALELFRDVFDAIASEDPEWAELAEHRTRDA